MAIIQGNFPYRPPAAVRRSPDALYNSFFGKIIVSADTTLVVDTNDEKFYNLLLNDSADADTDLNIPCFIVPGGTMIEDIGIEVYAPFTDAASFILGDSLGSDRWVDTVAFGTALWAGSDTNAVGLVRWMSQWENQQVHQSSALVDDTTFSPAAFEYGPRVVTASVAYSTATVVGLDSDDEPRPDEFGMHIHQKEAVAIVGSMSIYFKYNFSGLQIRELSSEVGVAT